MVGNWMAYLAAVSLLLAVAAWVAEQGLLKLRLATRWSWMVAILGVTILPVLPEWRMDRGAAVEGSSEIVGTPTPIGDIVPGLPAWSGIDDPELDRLLGRGWMAMSLVTAAYLLFSGASLAVRRRQWRRATFAGVDVWVAADVGPALVGFVRGEIVVPDWVGYLPERDVLLLIRHEREHLQARDNWLWSAALIALVAQPWNPLLWFSLRRLRVAVEVDCDARVLRGVSDLRAYAGLLLEVARRSTAATPTAAAFSMARSQLERRLTIMTAPLARSWGATVPATAAAVVLLLLASCGLDQPERGIEASVEAEQEAPPSVITPPSVVLDSSQAALLDSREMAGNAVEEEPAVAPALPAPRLPEQATSASPAAAVTPPPPGRADQSASPVFTPFEVRPMLRNASLYAQALERDYPPMLRDAGIGGTVTLWVYIDDQGSVTNTQIVDSTGYPQLDEIAQRLLRDVAEFSPARNRGDTVGVWVQLPVTFAP